MQEYDMAANGEVSVHDPVPAKEKYPYVDENGVEHPELIEHYREGGGKLFCYETREIYEDRVVDVYPCYLTYFEFDEPEEKLEEN